MGEDLVSRTKEYAFHYDPDFKPKKNSNFVNLLYGIGYCYFHALYSISFEHIERLEKLADTGFILLPKHQLYDDIPLVEMALKKVGREPYFLMKPGIPKIFEYGGGIRIVRGRDIYKRSQAPEGSKEKALMEALKTEGDVYNAVLNLLFREEIVTIFFEGTRNYMKSVDIKKRKNIRKLLELQTAYASELERLYQRPLDEPEKRIWFVPMDIKYEQGSGLRKKIIVKIGEPIQVPDNGLDTLTEHLASNIELITSEGKRKEAE